MPGFVLKSSSSVTPSGVDAKFSASSDFMTLLDIKANVSTVAPSGGTGGNFASYQHAAEQRHAHWLVHKALAIPAAEETWLGEALRALEYGWSFQLPAGNFSNTLGATAAQASEADAFFVQGYCRMRALALERVHVSVFTAMDAFMPDAITWLNSNFANLQSLAGSASNRFLFDAVAYIVGGGLVSNSAAVANGNTFLDFVLQNQDVSGYFPENGGYDSGYQGISLQKLADLYFHAGRTDIYPELEAGTNWLLSRIATDGTINTTGNTRTGPDGSEGKEVNYYEVAIALFYCAEIMGTAAVLDAANAVSEKGAGLV